MKQSRFLLYSGFVLLAALPRLIPYLLEYFGADTATNLFAFPWKLSPVAAICLFGGAHFATRRAAFLVPLVAMLLSDLAVGLLMHNMAFAFYKEMIFVYACFAFTIGMGIWLRRYRENYPVIASAALLSEVVFFLVTNFGTWYFSNGYYPPTAAGLVDCYIAAIPFINRSLLSMMLYGTILFGSYAWAERRYPAFCRQMFSR